MMRGDEARSEGMEQKEGLPEEGGERRYGNRGEKQEMTETGKKKGMRG